VNVGNEHVQFPWSKPADIEFGHPVQFCPQAGQHLHSGCQRRATRGDVDQGGPSRLRQRWLHLPVPKVGKRRHWPL